MTWSDGYNNDAFSLRYGMAANREFTNSSSSSTRKLTVDGVGQTHQGVTFNNQTRTDPDSPSSEYRLPNLVLLSKQLKSCSSGK